MYKILLLSLVLISVIYLGCDSTNLVTPSGPEDIQIDLRYNFENDHVLVELDGDPVFLDRVTTNHILSLAERIPLSIREGSHHLRVTVNYRVRSSQEFTAGNIAAIGVLYDRANGNVNFQLFTQVPLYD